MYVLWGETSISLLFSMIHRIYSWKLYWVSVLIFFITIGLCKKNMYILKLYSLLQNCYFLAFDLFFFFNITDRLVSFPIPSLHLILFIPLWFFFIQWCFLHLIHDILAYILFKFFKLIKFLVFPISLFSHDHLSFLIVSFFISCSIFLFLDTF